MASLALWQPFWTGGSGVFRPSNAISLRPAKTCESSAARPILAGDPTRIAQLVDEREQIGVVDFADIWFVSARVAGDLEVADVSEMLANALGEIACHDLAVVQIHLQKQVVAAHRLDDLPRLGGGVEKVPGDVPHVVDRLDEEANAVRFQQLGSIAQIADVYGLTGLA